MKTGSSLQEMALELARQREAKADYVADTRQLRMVVTDDGPRLMLGDVGEYQITPFAHRQIGDRIGIPAKYYDRMWGEAPDLLEHNVNHWFANSPERRLIRTLDGEMRAFLSDSYRCLDNLDLAEALLPALTDAGADIQSCALTPTKMYIKAVMSNVSVEIPPPPGLDGPGYRNPVVVQPGIVVSNSEVGFGAVSVEPAVHTLACLNMAVWANRSLRRRHVGETLASGNNEVWQYLSDQARALTDAAVWTQVRDLAQAALHGKVFDDIVAELTRARSEIIQGDPVVAVEKIGEGRGLTEGERGGVLRYLIEGGDLTKWGLHSAITRYSQDVEDYQRASELEQVGGEIITLRARDLPALVAVA